MTDDEAREEAEKIDHAILAERLRGIGDAVERGFEDQSKRCDRIEGAISDNRREANNRIAKLRDHFSQGIGECHRRIDEHLETHAILLKKSSKFRAVDVATKWSKWLGFIALVGTVAGGLAYVLYLLHKLIEAGVIK